MCGLLKRDYLDDVDVGFAFLERHWGKGYAQEAAAATLAHGWETFGLKRIAAITAPHNAGSRHVLEKLGFKFQRMMSLPGFPDESTFYLVEAPAS
jgi:RimJ/RimL family protein N-acetyltransferase